MCNGPLRRRKGVFPGCSGSLPTSNDAFPGCNDMIARLRAEFERRSLGNFWVEKAICLPRALWDQPDCHQETLGRSG